MKTRIRPASFLAPFLTLFSTMPFLLPLQADIFDDPENLKVLPKHISPHELRATMRGFSQALGVRCSDCHKGEEGQDLRSYDFAADEKELKEKARNMLKMVAAINENHLQDFGDERVSVTCMTCHRGVRKPKLIEQVLAEAADEGGSEAMISKYKVLKERYYGSHSYDFTDRTISDFARARGEAGNTDQTIAILDMMLEENPNSFSAHFIYGELKMHTGDRPGAVVHFEKALEINPEAGFIQWRLDQLKAQ